MILFEFVFDNGQTRRIKRAWGVDVYAALKSIGYGPVAMVSGVVWEWRELAEVKP